VEAEIQVVRILSLQQDDHETDRGEKSIAAKAAERDLALHKTKYLKDANYPKIVRHLEPNLAIVVGCRVLISERLCSISSLGTLAIHDSLLPLYHGLAPLN
jgi:methionyl-tRNA formyltransferase